MYNQLRIIPGVIPKYRQLLQILRNRILSGELPAGAQLPTEEELTQSYELSRGTVRKAIAQLEAEGLIRVEHGIGSFVRSARPSAIPFRFEDHKLWLERTGSRLTFDVLANEVIPAPMDVAERLSLSPSTPVIHIERLELLDNQVIAHSDRYLPESLCLTIVELDLSKDSIHNHLVDMSELPLLRAEMSIEMHILNEYESELVRTKAGLPGIFIERITFTAPNRPAVWYRGIFKEQYFFGLTVGRASP